MKSEKICKSKSLYCISLPYVTVLSWRHCNVALEIFCFHIILKDHVFIETPGFPLPRFNHIVFRFFFFGGESRVGGERGWTWRSPFCPLWSSPVWGGLSLLTRLAFYWYPLAQVYTILHSLCFTFEQQERLQLISL